MVGFAEMEKFLGEIIVVSQNAGNRGYSIYFRGQVKYVVIVSIRFSYSLRKNTVLALHSGMNPTKL